MTDSAGSPNVVADVDDTTDGKHSNSGNGDGDVDGDGDAAIRRSGHNNRRKSSFFARATKSFRRAGGSRGASVEALRGTQGAVFEGRGTVARVQASSAARVLLCCCGSSGGSQNDRRERFVLIKGSFCFVYASEEAPSPLFAVGLESLRPRVKEDGAAAGRRDGRVTVCLENHLGDLEYEFSFDTAATASEFHAAVTAQAAASHIETVRRRLGHGKLLAAPRASVVFAADVAKDKEREQPDVPVSTQDVIATLPYVGLQT